MTPPSEIFSLKDFERLEVKLDRMAEAVESLVLIEERQTRHAEKILIVENRMTDNEKDVRRLDKKVDRWLNMMFGACGVIVVLFELIKVVLAK